jgi:hypothetical protein
LFLYINCDEKTKRTFQEMPHKPSMRGLEEERDSDDVEE